eukprot:scaffold604_cov384-Prasinococcus_capsulatus_cf.AAC.21
MSSSSASSSAGSSMAAGLTCSAVSLALSIAAWAGKVTSGTASCKHVAPLWGGGSPARRSL